MNEPELKTYLKNEFLKRKKRNPKYSLRSFAKALEIESSVLSKLMTGKRGISRKMANHLGKTLGFTTPQDSENIQYAPINPQHFSLVSEWYHYAILELIKLPSFRPSRAWVARQLGISPTEVSIALENLQNAGLLRIGPKSWELNHSSNTNTQSEDYSDVHKRSLQAQILNQAIDALESIPQNSRDQSSTTFAANSALIPEAKKRIQKFRREITEFLQQGDLDQVCQISVSLFPVTKPIERKRNHD